MYYKFRLTQNSIGAGTSGASLLLTVGQRLYLNITQPRIYTTYLCVIFGSQNGHILSVFVTGTHCVFCWVGTEVFTLWRRNYFLNFCTPVYKMWKIQEPNKLALWNQLHF